VSIPLEITGIRVESDAGVLLDVPHLTINDAVIEVITGGADSGKTLLAAVLCGRASASQGTMRLHGRELGGGPAARRRAGLAATIADGSRISGCTVGEALRLAGSRRAAEALDRFALLARRQKLRAELLSGGEQQVLQVACAWCAAAPILVLDAPTSGLADETAAAVRQVARDSAFDGASVIWLDQAADAAPAVPTWQLVNGVLSPAAEEGSQTAPA
jgi:branched-chain amino acid transport system ATP-binding protein